MQRIESRPFALLRLLVLPLLLAGAAPLAAAELTTEATAEDQGITQLVAKLLEELHVSKGAIDDEKSQRTFQSFLETLDPAKIYFHKADIERLRVHEKQLDDQIHAHDLSFAFQTIRLFLTRVDEKLPIIDELLASEHDYTVNEFFTRDPDLVDYPASDAEVRERWRKRLKFELLLETTDGVSLEEAREKLTRRYHRFAKRMHQTDNHELLEMYLTALTTGFDPHSTYMGPHTLENFQITMSLELEGIGAELRSEDGYTTVSRVLPGGAASRDGRIKAGDRIVAVGQEGDQELVDVVEWKLSDVVPMIRGKRNTKVQLSVLPADGSERKLYVVTRDRVELKESEAKGKVFETGNKADGSPYKVGVIDLPSFYRDMTGAERGRENFRSTTRDVKKLLEEFTAAGVDSVVLDLRRNGGGSLTEAIDLTGLFIDRGPVVQVKSYDRGVRQYSDTESGTSWDGPLVVLTSKFSASASEILAGAIQDYQRGVVVGDAITHGKGSVQQLLDLGEFVEKAGGQNLGALKLTFQKFYRPNGDSTQNEGVKADIELPSLTTHLGIGEAELDYALAFDRVKAAEFERVDQVTTTLVAKLRQLSAARIEQNEDFQKVRKRIQHYLAWKERKTSSINREQFLAERKEIDPDQEEKKIDEALSGEQENTIERDYYLDEALEIAADLIRAKRQFVAK